MDSLNVLQATLTQTCDAICRTHGIDRLEVFERTEAFIRENSEKWRDPHPNIDYENPFCRMAYIYMNVAVHAHLVERAITAFPQIERVLRGKIDAHDELRVCALGGGPGSELLGLVGYLEGLKFRGRTAYLDFLLIDRIKEWDESWHALKHSVDKQLAIKFGRDRSTWPVSVSRSFLPLDVTSVADFENFVTRFGGTDIFILSYLVSELKTSVVDFEEVLHLLVAKANDGALLLFIDRDEREVRETVLQIVLRHESLMFQDTIKQRGRLTADLAELGEWYIHMPSLPRQKWLAFFTLAKKVAAAPYP